MRAGIICFDCWQVESSEERGRSRNGASERRAATRTILAAVDEPARNRGASPPREMEERNSAASERPRRGGRDRPGQETFVEKLICHYPAYKAKRLRASWTLRLVFIRVMNALSGAHRREDAEGFLSAVSPGHTCVTRAGEEKRE